MDFITITPAGAVASAQPPAQVPPGGFVWCDCPYDEARAWVPPVAALTGIDVYENHLLDAENPNHPSYFDSTRRYEMIVFRGLATPPADGTQRMLRVRTRPTVFFLMPGCLVTVRQPDSRLFPQVRGRVLDAAASRQRLPAAPEELMLRLLNGMVDRYLDLRQPLTEQVERWQRQLLDPRRPFRDWMLLLEMRGETRKLEQLCEEQLDAIQEWRDERIEHYEAAEDAGRTTLPALSESMQVRAADVVEHVHRVLNHARRLESSLESAVQLHFAATAYRTNEIMRTLTALTAIFLPLTLVTGVFGMNFDAIPGLHSPQGFWLTMGAMAAIAFGLLAWFRSRRYLRGSDLLQGPDQPRRRSPDTTDTAEY